MQIEYLKPCSHFISSHLNWTKLDWTELHDSEPCAVRFSSDVRWDEISFSAIWTILKLSVCVDRSEEGHIGDAGRSQGDCSSRQAGQPVTVQGQQLLTERVPHLPWRPVPHSLHAQAQVLTTWPGAILADHNTHSDRLCAFLAIVWTIFFALHLLCVVYISYVRVCVCVCVCLSVTLRVWKTRITDNNLL